MKGSIENQVKQIWHHLDGIGQSKRDSRKDSNQQSQNNQPVSKLVHSYKYKKEVLRIALEIGNFAKENFDITDFQQISNEVITSFFSNKVEEEVSYRSISNYVSATEKILVALTKIGPQIEEHKNLFTREILVEVRANAKTTAPRTKKENRAYINPLQIVALLPKKYFIVGSLQLHYGLRVIEALRIKPSQFDEESLTLTFKGKGGYVQKKVLNKKLFDSLKELVNDSVKKGEIGFKGDYKHYIAALQEAVSNCAEKWNGTHGLRYNYAQDRYDFYLDSGETTDEALRLTSEDLGHHRKEITGRYV